MDIFWLTAASISLIAIVYLLLLGFLRRKLVDQTQLQKLTKLGKEASELQKKAMKTKHPDHFKALEKKQIEAVQAMHGLMMDQIKLMVVLTFVFFFFLFLVSHYTNFYAKDDIWYQMNSNVKNVTIPAHARCGMWYVRVYPKGEGVLDHLLGPKPASYPFYVCHKVPGDVWVQEQRGWNVFGVELRSPIVVNVTPQVVQPGHNLTIKVLNGTAEKLSLDNGTRLYVDLPFRIPLIGIKRLYDPAGLFFLIIFIGGFIVNAIIDYVFPVKPKEKTGEPIKKQPSKTDIEKKDKKDK